MWKYGAGTCDGGNEGVRLVQISIIQLIIIPHYIIIDQHIIRIGMEVDMVGNCDSTFVGKVVGCNTAGGGFGGVSGGGRLSNQELHCRRCCLLVHIQPQWQLQLGVR